VSQRCGSTARCSLQTPSSYIFAVRTGQTLGLTALSNGFDPSEDGVSEDRHVAQASSLCASMDIMEVVDDAVELQIGLEGRTNLQASLESLDPRDVPAFLAGFRDNHSLKRQGITPALSFLDMCGVSRFEVHNAVLSVLIDKLLVLIKAAADAGDRDRVHALFAPTFRYLTVKELYPVALAVLENIDETVVGTDHWTAIIEAGLDNPPYIHLPLSLKRRIWSFHAPALEHEVDRVLRKVKEYVSSQNMHVIMASAREDDECRAGIEDVLKQLTVLSNNCETDAMKIIVERIVDAARGPDAQRQLRIALENSPLAAACQAASVIMKKSSEDPIHVIELQELRLLAGWLSGEIKDTDGLGDDLFEVLAVLFHSQRARDMLANQFTLTLERAAKRGTPPSTESLLKDPRLKDLATLTLSSIKAKQLLDDGQPLAETDVLALFESFVPLLGHEMSLDATWAKKQYDCCVDLPNPGLNDAVRRGCFERRVMCTYVYLLQSCPLPFYRFRLVLDNITEHSNNPGEEREFVLANQLIDSAFPETNM
jgi:hypothetical protein